MDTKKRNNWLALVEKYARARIIRNPFSLLSMKPHLPLLLSALLLSPLCTHAAVDISTGADMAPYSLKYSEEGYVAEYTLNL